MSSPILRSVVQSPSLPGAPYIYALCPTHDALFSISSDDVLRRFDPITLQLIHETNGVHNGVTCLKGWDQGKDGCIVTAGRDGMVRGWDPKIGSTKPVFEMGTARTTPLSALACHASQNTIAAGAEVEVSGHEADIYVWDSRHSTSPLNTYTDSHTDTITTLSFLPSVASTTRLAPLLSGSTDGLLTLFDTALSDEDDAVMQVLNHSSAVHKAGCLGGWVWATSSDETMAFYEIGDPAMAAEEEEEQGGVDAGKGVQVLGDVREQVGCRYVVDVVGAGDDGSRMGSIVVGDSTRNHLAAYPIRYENDLWSIQKEFPFIFDGAHGEEIVRDLLFDPGQGSNGIYYTCGEDGLIKAWKPEGGIPGAGTLSVGDEMDVDMEEVASTKPKRRKR